MQTIIKAWDKFWFITGLGFMVLGILCPREFWFLILLIPLISVLILHGYKHPIGITTRRNNR